MRRVWLAMGMAALAGTGVVGATRAQTPPVPVITNPDWLRKPTADEMLAVWPAEAARRGRGGKATISCIVNVTGALQACTVVSEDPPGSGFGQAAIMLAGAFKMKPMKVDGKAVAGGTVRIPVLWHGAGNGAGSGFGGMNIQALTVPVWARAPSFEAMAAAWPKDAAELSEGSATLRCTVSPTATLRNCRRLNELPRGKGFGSAAMGLADKFVLKLTPEELKKLRGGIINVPFRFLNPASPDSQGRKLTKPRWIVQINPDKVLALYPAIAADAGVRKGIGVADCLVAADGRLTDCKVARETPEAMGFGPAAVAIAGVMQMNPWTDEGRPVDGARIRLPINFTQAEETVPKAKP